ncbi:hypothetical protein HYS90_02715 [Candidatus Curtissbacteria bacterium]|nr:hypothetical protein [Candidatus Curtissbacteria bacterium]
MLKKVNDPSNYLKNTSFSYSDGSGSTTGTINPNGSLNWPINDPIIISQGFGNTPYAKSSGFYGPGGHTGIDMYNNPSAFPVKAVKDGKLYGGSVGCAGRTLYYAKIDHGDGLITWYLHMVPN